MYCVCTRVCVRVYVYTFVCTPIHVGAVLVGAEVGAMLVGARVPPGRRQNPPLVLRFGTATIQRGDMTARSDHVICGGNCFVMVVVCVEGVCV